MSAPRVVTFFNEQSTHFVETMACFLAEDPQLTIRVVTSRRPRCGVNEHSGTLERLERHDRIEVVDLDAPAMDSSLVIFRLVRHVPQPPALAAWLARSAASAIFPEANRYGGRADWLRELARAFPHFLRARFLILERRPLPSDFRFGCLRRVIYTPSVHPQFLSEPLLRAAMFGAVPGGIRRFKLAFLGNRQPPERSLRLEACLAALRAQEGLAIAADGAPRGPGALQALWIEYDIAAGTRGLDPLAYVGALSETEFCLSPPGWGFNWTHRTIEAVVRGAIPVIEDPELYDLPFVDGVNCVVVGGADWALAVRRCLAFPPEQIARLRAGALRLREERLLPEVAARDFRRAFMKAAW